MAKPIDHDVGSTMATAGYSAAKWGIAGLLMSTVVGAALFAVGAVLAGGAIGGIGGLLASYTPKLAALSGATFSTGAAFALTSGWVMGLAGTIGAGVGVAYGTIPAAIGAVFGLAKGGANISAESAAYRERAEAISQPRRHKLTARINDAEIAGMQQGYALGVQDAQTQIAQQLQAMAMQEQAAQTAPVASDPAAPAAGAVAMASAEAKCDCGPHTKAVIDQRQAAAAAGVTPQVG